MLKRRVRNFAPVCSLLVACASDGEEDPALVAGTGPDGTTASTPQGSEPNPSQMPGASTPSDGLPQPSSPPGAGGAGGGMAGPSESNGPQGGASGGESGGLPGAAGGGVTPSGGGQVGVAGAAGVGGNGAAGTAGQGAGGQSNASFPFPTVVESEYCLYPTNADSADVRAAYDLWKETVVTDSGAGGFLRVRKPDSGTVIDSTVSEGMGYGLLLAVYMDDQDVFDNLWKYTKLYFNGNGLMNWEVDPDGVVIGQGGATDGDEDMAWALVMADRQWGGQGSLDRTYLEEAVDLINAIWDHEIDHTRDQMVKAGDAWGDVDVTNPSYFAPAYYKVFAEVTGNDDWHLAVDSSYLIIERSLNAASGNQSNGLVPAWCNSQGVPVEAYGGAPLHFQNDSTRTPFRVGQDYCYFGEPRAKAYLDKITAFYKGVGVANIVDGYELDGTPRPERSTGGLQASSFVGPAAVGAMSDPTAQAFVDEAYTALATQGLTAGTIYYQKSWTALSLLMLTGNFFELPPR